jgi:putative hydrolase of the HAD superfamily
LFKITIVGISTEFRGVITDWGGVLTSPILTTVRAWIEADEIDWDSYRTVMRRWVSQAYDIDGGANPIHALERGECATDEFERLLAARLVRIDGGAVSAKGLLQRMFAASERVPAMDGAIRAVRVAGLRTGLLSNSWGAGDYPLEDFPDLFDAVVISGEVGMRKPEERIFLHAADALGLAPAQCVFIDDMEANVAAATDLGMTALLHTEAAVTVAALEDLLGVSLNGNGKAGQASQADQAEQTS